MGVSASAFLLISMGGYLYHRGQLADIAAEHLRLMITGPARAYVGSGQRYTVRTTTVTGHPVPAQVELTVYGADGQPLMAHKESADEQGLVGITVEADPRWIPSVRIEVVGSYRARTERLEADLTVERMGRRTALCVDQADYRPGETVRFRSLTLSPLSLAVEREVPIRFEVRSPNGSLIADAVREGITAKGMGWGEFLIPKDAAEGLYAVHAVSPDHEFPDQRRQFTVARDEQSGLKIERASFRERERPGDKAIRVSFRPEGGELVAETENRVYFSAIDGVGKPVHLAGRIVNSQDRPVALVEATHEGMGSFLFEPQVGEQYRLKLDNPSAGQADFRLPAVSADHSAVLTTGLGILEPGMPLEFNVRATAAGLPLAAAVSCRGIEVGVQTLVASVGANTVTLPLDEEGAGTLRLAVYECRSSPPRLIAERLIFRRPRKRLEVHLALEDRSFRPGESIDLPLRTTDEEGKPLPADLSVAVFDEARYVQATMSPDSAVSQLLLLGELENPQTIENVDFYCSTDSKAPAALDLLLGARARRSAAHTTPLARSGRGAGGEGAEARWACPPPLVFDNLSQLLGRYQASLASYRVNRTRVLNALTTLSFFGGVGLVVFVAMLSLLNIPSGLRLWGPSLGVAAACIVIGAILMDPERLKPNQEGDVPFTSYAAPSRSPDDPGPPAAQPAAKPQARSPFSPSRFEVPQRSDAAAIGKGAGTLVWRPLVSTDDEGRASVRLNLPTHPASCRLVVDAHAGPGRIASFTALIRSQVPSKPRGGTDSAAK